MFHGIAGRCKIDTGEVTTTDYVVGIYMSYLKEVLKKHTKVNTNKLYDGRSEEVNQTCIMTTL